MPPDSTVTALVGGGAAVVAFDGVREFFKHVAGKLGDDVGEFLRASTTYRLVNIASKMKRAHEMLEAAGHEPLAVPPRTLLPWLEHASAEDNADLSERWAAILANAAIATDEEDAPPIYANMLAGLTPFAARVLDLLQRSTKWRTTDGRVEGTTQTSTTSIELLRNVRPDLFGADVTDAKAIKALKEECRSEERRINAAIDVLIRQGLVTGTPRFKYKGQVIDGRLPVSDTAMRSLFQQARSLDIDGVEIRMTELGIRFLEACTPPKSKPT